jgi:hypothetical protein
LGLVGPMSEEGEGYEMVCFRLVSEILCYSGLIFMFSNIYIYVYTICTKYFDKNNGYSTEYP